MLYMIEIGQNTESAVYCGACGVNGLAGDGRLRGERIVLKASPFLQKRSENVVDDGDLCRSPALVCHLVQQKILDKTIILEIHLPDGGWDLQLQATHKLGEVWVRGCESD